MFEYKVLKVPSFEISTTDSTRIQIYGFTNHNKTVFASQILPITIKPLQFFRDETNEPRYGRHLIIENITQTRIVRGNLDEVINDLQISAAFLAIDTPLEHCFMDYTKKLGLTILHQEQQRIQAQRPPLLLLK